MNFSLDECSRLDFVLALRRRWADTLYPALRAQVEADEDNADVRSATHRQPTYPWFAFMERASQKMLLRDVADAVEARQQSRHGESNESGKAVSRERGYRYIENSGGRDD